MTKHLTIEDVCERLGLTRGALAQMRYEGRGPVFMKISAKQVRYAEADVEAWENSVKQTTTAVAA